jgi:hypothetical protein
MSQEFGVATLEKHGGGGGNNVPKADEGGILSSLSSIRERGKIFISPRCWFTANASDKRFVA